MPNTLPLMDAARLALQCLDLTSLNDADTPADIATLCQRAQTRFGPVAAVCVWRIWRWSAAQAGHQFRYDGA